MNPAPYRAVLLKFFSEQRNYYCMFSHYHRTLELYIDLLILASAYQDVIVARTEKRTSPHVHLEKYLTIYLDSYMVKLRQLFSPRENGMAHDFYKEVISLNNRKYYQRDQGWLLKNYPGGAIDKYQKLEFHSNQHLKYYRISHRVKHKNGSTSYFRTPLTISYLYRTEPYIKRLATAIHNFRKNNQYEFGSILLAPLNTYDHLDEMQKVFDVKLTDEQALTIRVKVAKLNETICSPDTLYYFGDVRDRELYKTLKNHANRSL